MANNEVKLKLSVDGSAQVVTDVGRVGDKLGSLDGKARQAAQGADALKTALGAMATIGTVMAVTKMADSITTLNTQLRLSSNSAQEATKAYGALFDIAQRSRVSFTELGTTYAAIARSGKEMGVSQDRLLAVTQSISQAMTIGGGSAASMQAALVQLGQGLSSGTLRGEELNSIMEQTPRLAKALADGLGVPIGKLRELGAAGQLTSEQVINALEKAGPQLAKEMESATLTVGQAFTMLTNSATNFVGTADNASGASKSLADALKSVSGGIDSVGKAIKDNETAFAVIVGGLAGAATIAGIGALAAKLDFVAVAVGAIGAVTAPAIGAVAAFTAGLTGLYIAAKNVSQSKTVLEFSVENLDAKIAYYEKSTAALTKGQIEQLEKYRDARKRIQAELALMDTEYVAKRTLRQMDNALDAQAAKEAEKNANALDALRQKMSKVPAGYVERMKEIIRLNQAGVLVGKEYTDTLAAQQDVLAKATGDAAKSKAETSELSNALKTYNDLIAKSAGLNANFTEEWNKLSLAYKAGKFSVEGLTKAQAELLKEQAFSKDIAKEQEEQTKASAKAQTESTTAYIDGLDAADKRIKKLENETAKEIIKTAALGGTKDALENLMAAELESQAGLLERNAQADIERWLIDDHTTSLLKEAQALRDRAKSLRDYGAKEVTVKAADEAASEWKKAANKINDSITDALMRGFENGKGFAENLRDTVVNMFSTMVLRPVISAIVSPVAQGITGMMGLSGAANAAGAASSASSLMSTGGMLAAAGTYGKMFGGAMADGWGAAMAGNASGAISGGLGAVGTGTASTTVGMGQAIGAAAPYVLAALVAIEAAKGLDGGSEYTTGTGIKGSFGNSGFTGNNYQTWKNDGSKLFGYSVGSSSSGTNLSAMDENLSNLLGAGFDAMKTEVGNFAKGLGLSVDIVKGFSKDITVAFGSNAEENKAALAKMMQVVNEEMANVALASLTQIAAAVPSIVNEFSQFLGESVAAAYGKTLADGTMETSVQVLARLSSSLQVVNSSFKDLGQALMPIGIAGADAASQIIDAFGGLQGFISETSAYFNNFYSEAEKRTAVLTRVSDMLAESEISLSAAELGAMKTRDEFRNYMASLGGQAPEQYAALVKAANAFASVTPAAAAAATAVDKVKEAADKLKEAEDSLLKTWQDKMDTLNGMTDRERDLASTTVQATRELMTMVHTLEDVAAASAKAKDLTEKYTNPMTLAGAKAALPASVADSLLAKSSNEARDAITTYVKSLDANTDAGRAAIAQVDGLTGALDFLIGSIEATEAANQSWQNQLDVLTGAETERSIALRDATADSTRELMNQVYAQQDLKTAAQATEAEITRLTSVLESAKSAVTSAQSAVDSIRGEATNAYLVSLGDVATAQENLAKAQQDAAINLANVQIDAQIDFANAANTAAREMQDLGKQLREFVDGAALEPTAQFGRLLTAAMSGDKAAMQALPGAATGAIDAAKLTSNALDFAKTRAAIVNQVAGVAGLAERLGANTATVPSRVTAPAQDAVALAKADLALAQNSLAQSLSTANAIGAPLTASITDLIGKFNTAQQESIKAQASLDAAQKALDAIQGNTKDTVNSVDALKEKFTIELALAATTKVTDYLTIEATALTVAQRDAALAVLDNVTRTIDLVADAIKESERDAALAALVGVSRTVKLVAEALTSTQADIAISVLDNISKSVSLAVTAVSTTQRDTALDALAGMTKAVALTLTKFNTADDALILAATAGATKTITAALGTGSADALMLAKAASDNVTRTLSASGGTLTEDQRAILKSVADGNAAVTLNSTVKWDVTDGMKSIFMSIREATMLTYKQLTGGTVSVASDGTIALSSLATSTTGAARNVGGAGFTGTYFLMLDSTNYLQQISEDIRYFKTNGHDVWVENGISAAISNASLIVKFDRGTAAGAVGGAVFAHGGAFTNGIVSRPTAFNASLMGEAGPEAIMPLANINGSLGVRFAGNSSNDVLVAEIRALRAEVAELRKSNSRENTAIASHAATTADATRNMDRNGSQTYNIESEPHYTVPVV